MVVMVFNFLFLFFFCKYIYYDKNILKNKGKKSAMKN